MSETISLPRMESTTDCPGGRYLPRYAEETTVPTLWGVYDRRDETGEVHVAPCNTSGDTAHVLSADCWCGPVVEKHGIVDMVVHECRMVA